MEQNTKHKINVKDFFLNLGATISLYVVVVSLVNLLFTVIDNAYPKITNAYLSVGSSSISWPVATLVIFTPILILLMWLLEKEYRFEPSRKDSGIHKWLTYLTLFLAGLALAGDLITVLYYFIDGQELSTAFLLKCFALLVVAGALFGYYISDIMNKLNSKSRMGWRVISVLIVLVSIIWGFYVLGSPATQRKIKYDQQKVTDLMNISGAVQGYYSTQGSLPKSFEDLSKLNYYMNTNDSQSRISYEYKVTGKLTYELCAEFNMDSSQKTVASQTQPYGGSVWTHPAGKYCFKEAIVPSLYPAGKLPM